MAYSGAFGWQEHFGDETPDPCPNLSRRDCFEPAPCSRAGGLVSLISEGAATEPPLSVDASGMAADPPAPVISWGAAAEPPPPSAPQRRRPIRLPHPPILQWHPGWGGRFSGSHRPRGRADGSAHLHRPHGLTSLRVKQEGSLHVTVGVCQHVLILQDFPIHVSGYLVVIAIITAYLLSSIMRLLLL